MAGLLPFRGFVSIQNRLLQEWPTGELARHMAWLGQGDGATDALCVADLVMLGRLPYFGWLGAPSRQDHDAVQWAMTQTQCVDWAQRRLSELSAGQMQRVLMARAFATQARLLIMDEPLSHLDVGHQVEWVRGVRERVSDGAAVITVLHELSAALQADDVVVMRDGQVLHAGASTSADTHDAVASVFDCQVNVRQLDGCLIAAPKWR